VREREREGRESVCERERGEREGGRERVRERGERVEIWLHSFFNLDARWG
jgi:hypothetical protein